MATRKPASLSHLQTIPLEILEPIYIQSENLAFIYVCRRFYSALNVDNVRLRFCTNTFYRGNPKRSQSDGASRIHLQTAILSNKWFTLELSAQIENAVKKLQEREHRQKEAEAKAYSATHLDSWRSARAHKVLCADGVTLPRRLLYGPWTDDKINFLARLVRWNAKATSQDSGAAERGIQEAIMEGRPDVVILLSQPSIGIPLDMRLLRLAVLKGGCNKSIVKMFAAFASGAPDVDWSDRRLWAWALKKADEGDEKGLWLLEMLKTNGEMFSDDECDFILGHWDF